MKKILKIVASLVLVAALGFAGLVGYLWATEYSPNGVESLQVKKQGNSEIAKVGTEYSALNWNMKISLWMVERWCYLLIKLM